MTSTPWQGEVGKSHAVTLSHVGHRERGVPLSQDAGVELRDVSAEGRTWSEFGKPDGSLLLLFPLPALSGPETIRRA